MQNTPDNNNNNQPFGLPSISNTKTPSAIVQQQKGRNVSLINGRTNPNERGQTIPK
jgi:hypothetical protein